MQPSMSSLQGFERKLAEAWEPSSWQDVTVLVAVSGGADSVALLRALVAIQRTGEGRLIAAHLNHQLRGAEAAADEAFVVTLCRELQVPCEVGRASLTSRGCPNGGEGEAPAEPSAKCSSAGASPSQGQTVDSSAGASPSRSQTVAGPADDSSFHPDVATTTNDAGGSLTKRFGSLEAAARAARYGFLTDTASRVGARYVVTAHTADDQAETILHRIVRGTGIAGLAGMARTRPLSAATTLIRPLLGVHRGEVLAYLDALAQPYCRDSSNTDPQFTRNRIRHELLPHLAAEFNSGVVAALLRLGKLAGEAQAVMGRLVEELAERCVVGETSGAVRIAVAPLAAQTPYVVRELLMWVWRQQGWPLQAMGYAQWEQLAAMAQGSERGQQVFPGGVVVARAHGQLRLVRQA